MVAPGVVLAAPASGTGKTTLATGLMAALTARGQHVAPFKVGPDFIDPSYHSVATGRVGRNLDSLLVGAGRIAPLYAHGSSGCDIAVIEGVMGLFDGKVDDAAPSAQAVPPGSTAEIAALLGTPVLLVVDARGHSQSLAALVRGFATHDTSTRIAGVILNRVGSSRHVAILTAACESVGIPVVGAVPRVEEVHVPSRHLGLVTAQEYSRQAQDAVARMGEIIADSVDLDGITALADSGVECAPWDAVAEIAGSRARDGVSTRAHDEQPVTIALAAGPAFTFAYAEHVELLNSAGAQVRIFDPLVDQRLPEGTEALIIPGGFPEEYLAALGRNLPLLTEIRQEVAGGLPVQAECAGLLYLSAGISDSRHEQQTQPLCGVLPVAAHFGSTLTLGYREAVALEDSLLYRAGERVTGHEFHRTTLSSLDSQDGEDHGIGPELAGPAWAWRNWRGNPESEGLCGPSLHASYLHTHPAGHPETVSRFVDAARNRRDLNLSRPGTGEATSTH